MTIALFLQAIQALTGSQFVKDKLQRSEYVIRVLKAVGIDPEHPPEDFEAVYVYALVEYGYGKPDVCLEIFRAAEIRSGFRRSFDENNPQEWLTSGEAFLTSSEIGEKVRSSGCEASRELAEFAAAFLKVTRRSQTPKETLVQHQLRKIERTIDRKLERVAGQLEAIANPAALSPAETLTLIAASCRAGELALRMRSWFEVLGYHLEPTEKWDLDYFEWVINIPKRRGFDRVLVRGIAGEAKVHDVIGLRESVGLQRVDEGWLVTERRISKAARSACEAPENADLFCFTFDEFLDQDADFEGYLDWLEAEILARGIESRYVPLACMKEEFDPMTHQRLGMSRYGESDGWTEGYIDLWLDDPAKEHLSILGEFGTGKTWLTLHYASIAVSKYRSAKANGVERPRLPIVIPLRDYAKAVSVESLFSEFFFRKHEIPIPGYSAFVELNRMGKLLLIFDGFDEMAARVDKQQMINNFWELAKVVVPGSKVILTCRTEHFPDAKEGRSLLNAELQASTRGLSGETPQFEVLELEKFDDSQIREVLLLASSSETVAQVMGNPQLLDLARRPVMTELILEALPDIEAGKPVDMSRVYLYAVRRKMERDIRAERTFTSMADKLYFLCELSWEMLSNDRMSLNYREFPDRIRKLFGSAVQEEKDLDHWHYDMMGQTMLIRNSDGDYQPAHRSLLEFFVAFKFAAELGTLAPDFLELAQMKSGIDRTLEPRDYTWSEYFGGGAIAPLKGFVTESLEVLRSGFGTQPLSEAVVLLIATIVLQKDELDNESLMHTVLSTRNKVESEVGYIGGNIINIVLQNDRNSLEFRDLSGTILTEAIFLNACLRDTNFSDAILKKAKFKNCLSSIFSITFMSDDNVFATGDGNGVIRLWDILNGQEILTLNGHSDLIWSMAFNKNNELLASIGNDKKLSIWKIETGDCLSIVTEGSKAPEAVIFNPLDDSVIYSSNDGDIQIRNPFSGDYIATLEGDDSPVRSICLDRSGEFLVSGASNGVIRIWNLKNKQCIQTINSTSEIIWKVVISPDSKIIAVNNYQSIELRGFNGNHIGILEGHSDLIYSMAFSSDSKFLTSGSRDTSIKIWDVESKTCISTLEGHTNTVHAVAFSPVESVLVSGGFDSSLRIWDTKSKKSLRVFQGETAWIRSIYYCSKSRLIASGDDNGDIKIWNLDKKKDPIVINGHKKAIYSVSISCDEKIMISSSYDKTIRIWDLESCTCRRVLVADSTVFSVAMTRDGSLFASAHHSSNIQIWDVLSGQSIRDLKGHTGWVKSIKFSPDEKLLASCSGDKTVRIWDVNSGDCLHIFALELDYLLAVDFHSSGRYLATGGYEGLVRIWDLDSAKCINVLKGHGSWIRCLAFQRESDLLASAGNDSEIRLWNIHSGQCLMILKGHSSTIESLSFSQDGSQLASSSRDSTIRVWDVHSGKCILILRSDKPYEGMNITGVKGLSPGTIATLKALGAVENEE
jgi:WD40 repeat protein